MPVQTTDTSNDRLKKSGPDIWNKKDPGKKESERDIDAEDIQANYGFARDAELNTAAEETERQEYMANGLPRTQQYTIDKAEELYALGSGNPHGAAGVLAQKPRPMNRTTVMRDPPHCPAAFGRAEWIS